MVEIGKGAPVDLILVTGFLGAGKTTFLNHLLGGISEKRIGVLVNDFGAIPVDSVLIRPGKDGDDGDLDVYEVSNGSIFCSCKSALFVQGLRMFARRRPELILVEASGMSDPSGLYKILRDNRLLSDFRIRSVVCLVDAIRVPKLRATLPAIDRQIASADVVLLNKSDLADEKVLSELEQMTITMNPDAAIYRTSFAKFPAHMLSNLVSHDDSGVLTSCNSPSTRPASLHLVSEDLSKERVESFLRSHLAQTYRIKGWIKADGRWWYLSDNSGRLEWESQDLPQGIPPGLTLICPPSEAGGLMDDWSALTA